MLNRAGAVLLAVMSGASLSAQTLLPKSPVQHATVAASASGAAASPGATITLWADVKPQTGVHVYAAGARGFTPVSVVLTPNAAVKTGRPTYPTPDIGAKASSDATPAYYKPFRIGVPVTIAPTAPRGQQVIIAGAVNYQACDDLECYPVAAAPVRWQIDIK